MAQVDGERYLVRYHGYGDSSNEWAGPDRLRFLPRGTPKNRPRNPTPAR